MMAWLDVLIQGVLLGGLYALFALGLSLMFGVMRLTNVAHGDVVVLAAFAAIAGAAALGGSPWHIVGVALLLLPLAFAAGFVLQRFVLNGTLGRDPLPSMVVTFGLSIVLQNALLQVFSADRSALSPTTARWPS
jgi:branched-chain amino acid transport system permease protein